MSFGEWIVVAFVLFGIFITSLVVICVREEVSLVSADYYQEELVYQDQIQRLNNTASLSRKPSIKVVGGTLQVALNQTDSVGGAVLKLFRPSNEKMDRSYPVVSGSKVEVISLEAVQRGMYRARLYWSMNEEEFYWEEVIYI